MLLPLLQRSSFVQVAVFE